MQWMVLLLFGTIGLATMLSGMGWAVQRFRLVRAGVRTEGIVVENVSVGRSVYPIVGFCASDGKPYKVRGSTGKSTVAHEEGDRLPVVYARGNPLNAAILTFDQCWMGPVLMGFFGFLCLVVGVIGFLLVSGHDGVSGAFTVYKTAREGLGIAAGGVVGEVRVGRNERRGPPGVAGHRQQAESASHYKTGGTIWDCTMTTRTR